MRRLLALAASCAASCAAFGLMSGCASLGDHAQSVGGHLRLMQAARPLQDWLADEATSPGLKDRLQLAARIRSFAVRELHLPDNRSYQSYAELGRPAALWNVVAAPEFSLQLVQHCFLVAGCVSYQGFFSEARAQARADALRARGLDVAVLPVPAYSTLGWLNWAGGDPLLSSFIALPEAELARLLFHELAHQVVYLPGDTGFNESFATAVERLGSQQWLAQAEPEVRAQAAQADVRRTQFRALAQALRRELAAIYGQAELPAPAMRALKAQAFERFRARMAERRSEWGRTTALDAWLAQANNASVGALAEYEDLAPAFEALFEQSGSWPRFYDAVRRLARLPREQRQAALQALSPAASSTAR